MLLNSRPQYLSYYTSSTGHWAGQGKFFKEFKDKWEVCLWKCKTALSFGGQLGYTVPLTLVHTGNYRTKDNTQTKHNPQKQQNKTALVQSPFTTLGQKTRLSYSTMPPSSTTAYCWVTSGVMATVLPTFNSWLCQWCKIRKHQGTDEKAINSLIWWDQRPCLTAQLNKQNSPTEQYVMNNTHSSHQRQLG